MDENNKAGKSGLELAGQKGILIIVMEPHRGEWALHWIGKYPQVMVVYRNILPELLRE